MTLRPFIALTAVALLGGCTLGRSIYAEPDDAITRCNALPEPGDRAACIERLGRETHARRDAPRVGPPACHPASTDPRDRNEERC